MSAGHDHDDELALRVEALESLLVEKGLVDSAVVDEIIRHYEQDVGPMNGARVVARAWVDPAYKARLLADGTAAVAELGYGGREGGHVRVRVEERQATPPPMRGGPEGRYARIVVADEGQGIAAQDLPHVFEPFFTTKGPGEGTGLGLAIAEGIVQDAGGWIEVRSEHGRGTEMAIHLPPAQGTQVTQADSA